MDVAVESMIDVRAVDGVVPVILLCCSHTGHTDLIVLQPTSGLDLTLALQGCPCACG